MNRAHWRHYKENDFLEVHPKYNQFDVYLLIYSITDSDSMDSTCMWLDSVQPANLIMRASSALCVLVGNKCDMEESREVSLDRGMNMADNLLLDSDCFFEISAKNGEGFDRLFEFIVQKLGTIEKGSSMKWNTPVSRFKINDRVCVRDRSGSAHHGTVSWTGVKKRIGRKDGEMCVEIQMVISHNIYITKIEGGQRIAS